METLCRFVRNDDSLFGGIQVILAGDFYQLPPVPDPLTGDDGAFCFFADYIFSKVCHVQLKHVKRQHNLQFVQAINECAKGKLSDQSSKLLQSCARELPADMSPTHIYSTNIEVEMHNAEALHDMEGVFHKYESCDEGINKCKTINPEMCMLYKLLSGYYNYRYKVGVRIKCKNCSFDIASWVNIPQLQ